MYIESDVLEIGKAHKLILSEIKDWFMHDDWDHLTFWVEWPWPFDDPEPPQ